MTMYGDMQQIIQSAIKEMKPDSRVCAALKNIPDTDGKRILVSVGKAGWQMAYAAQRFLGDKLDEGYVITKYHHVQEDIPGINCFEAGHPVPDENSVKATECVLEAVSSLSASDQVIFLLSGGGSALFEKPLIPLDELKALTEALLRCGASIQEINVIRKKLSAVKGGKFAKRCEPAKVYSVILSDVLGDPLDLIASGPTVSDGAEGADALDILSRYGLSVSQYAMDVICNAARCTVRNNQSFLVGSVALLCDCAARAAAGLGYEPVILTDELNCEAKEAGKMMASIARYYSKLPDHSPKAFIAGGETVVKVTGSGLGGRNQELVLSAASAIEGMKNVLLFSFGSDGTDGPTDAAGGFVDGESAARIAVRDASPEIYLAENDSYHGLSACGGLLMTGPTGTNVNDVTVLLVR
ncbi:MAG: glycerate kinase [Anaerovoracaceae bacterium]